MTKVSLPLGSAAAFGKFGSMLVFQGNWVRSYVTPYDPKTPAQVAVREVFRDITKQEAQFGLWAKNALRTVVGSRWYTGLYKRVTENSYERFGEAVGLWNAFTTEQQDAWDSAALFQETTIRPGLAFFAVMFCVKEWLDLSNAPDYGLGNVNGSSSASNKTWATKSLDGVFTSGSYDDDDALLQYLGSWTDIADGSAFGGSYKQSDASGSPSVSFYFYGTQLFLNYLKKTGAGGLQVSSFAFGTEVISQNNSMTLYGQSWTSRGAIRGLHYVTLTRTGAGAVNIDKIIVGNKTNPTADFLAKAEISEVPSVCLTLKEPWSVPGWGDLWAVYWDRELWDVGGMHDAPDPPYRIRTLVSGRYDLRCQIVLLFQQSFGGEFRTGELFVYVDNTCVAYDVKKVELNGLTRVALEVNRSVDLSVGQMLTVYVKHNKGVDLPVSIEPDYTPLFQLELTQRTSLLVETMNVTQNIGTDHGAMNGLDDDDHPQYLTEERADDRYSQLGHVHHGFSAFYAHLLSQTIPASSTRYCAPFFVNLLDASERGMPILRSGKLKNFYLRRLGQQPASGSCVVYVRKIGVGDVISLMIPENSNAIQTLSDTTTEVSVNPGDQIGFKFVNNATESSAPFGFVAVEFIADV